MDLETDLNVPPYNIDYDANTGYVAELFRPRMAVQGRELSTLQFMAQEQVARFGKHVFKDGSIVDGVAITYYPSVHYISVEDNFTSNANSVPSDFEGYLVTNGSNTSTAVRAVVKLATDGAQASAPDTNKFYLSYIMTGKDGANDVSYFLPGDTLYVYNDNQNKFGMLDANNLVDTINTLTSNGSFTSNGFSYCIGVSDGIIFQKGYFLKVEPQVITINAYGTTVNGYGVGFNTVETIVTENEDESLYDNALGYPNENAPGAHRLKLTPTLVAKPLANTTSNTNFFAIVEFDGSNPTEQKDSAKYAELEKKFAQEKYEESGNYVVNPFTIETRVNSANSETFYYEVSPGVAYVRGFRVEKIGPTKIEAPRATTTEVAQNQSISANYGSYVVVNEFVGAFDTEQLGEVSLYDTPQYAISDKEGSSTTPIGNVVGKANIRAVMFDTGTKGHSDATFLIYLFNIRMNSGKSFTSDAKSIYYTGTFGVAKADLVLEDGIAVLKDSSSSSLLFNSGLFATKRLTDNTGIGDTTYTYHQIKSGTMNSSGAVTITLDTAASGASSEKLTDTSNVTTSAGLSDYSVFFSGAAYSANQTGTIAVTSGNTLVIGSGTSFADAMENTLVRIHANTTVSYVRRVTDVINTTAFTIDSAFPVTNASTKYQKYYAAGTPVPLVNVSINSNTSFTANFGETLDSGSQTVYCQYPVYRNQATAIPKVIKKNIVVKIDCSNNAANTVGPWNLGFSDVHKIRNVYLGTTYANTNPDRTDWFTLDSGQRDDFYDHSKLVVLPEYSAQINTNSRILVVLDHFVPNTSASVGFFSVDSYPIDDANTANTNAIQTIDLPFYNGVELRNYVDFRPVKANTATSTSTIGSATVNPATNANTFAIAGTGQYLIAPDTNFTADFEYYLPRIDMVAVDFDGNLSALRGVPNVKPRPPAVEADQMVIAQSYVPAYPSATQREYEASKTVSPIRVAVKDNRRYTMSDIGTINERLKRVEYYTALNAIEQQARDMTIPDENGLDRFKNGIFADPFNSHNIGNVSDFEYKIAIDSDNSIARPLIDKHDIDFTFTPNTSGDSEKSSGVVRTGPIVTLAFDSESWQKQRFATKYRNATQSLWKWNGVCELYPSLDFFRDERPPVNINASIDLAAPWQQFATTPFAQIFGDWRTISTQRSVQSNTVTQGSIETTTTTRTTTTTQEAIVQQLRIDTFNQSIDFGTYVKDFSVQPYMRSRLVAFVARSLKPNTRVHCFFDDVNVDEHCAPGVLSGLTDVAEGQEDKYVDKSGEFGDALTSDANGFVCGIFRIPEETFRTGDRIFQITNIDDITTGNDARVTTAKARFTADSTSITRQSTTLNVRQPQVFHNAVPVRRSTTTVRTDISVVDLNTPQDFGAGGSGDGGGCFVSGSVVTMEDGSIKPVELVVVGDRLKGKGGINTVLELSRPSLRKMYPDGDLYGLNFKSGFVTAEHPFYTAEGWKSINPGMTQRLKPMLDKLGVTQLRVGDQIYKDDGSFEIVTSINHYPGQADQTLFNFKLDGDETYYVNGLLVHNKPIAQSFSVANLPDSISGIFLTEIGVYFKDKSPALGCNLFVCEMTNNFPDMSKILARSHLESADIVVSDDGTEETTFTLEHPIYLLKDNDYCFIVQPVGYNPEYYIWCAETGNFDVATEEQVFVNPSTGTLFFSANRKTWTDVQLEDIKYNLYRAKFTSNSGTAIFKNENDEYMTIDGITSVNTSASVAVGDIVYTVNSTANTSNTANLISHVLTSGPSARVQWIDQASNKLWLDSSNGGFSNSTNPTIAFFRTSDYSNTSLLNANTIVGFTTIETIDDPVYHAVVPKFGVLQPFKTSTSFSIKGTKSSGSTVDSTYTTIQNEYEFEFPDAERNVVSKSNEVANMSSAKSAVFKINMESLSDYVSPVLDLSRKSFLFIENKINNDANNEHTRYGEALSKYVSKRVILKDGQEAEDLEVYLTASRPPGTDVKVYTKVWNNYDPDSFDDKAWSELENTGNTVYTSASDVRNYVEYKFTMPSANVVNSGAFANSGTISYGTMAGGISLGASNTVITGVRHTFNANSGVSNTADTITITNANTYFRVGDRVMYNANGGTEVGGISNGSIYFISFANTTAVTLSTTKTGANIDLTSGPAATHYLQGTFFTEDFDVGDKIRVESNTYVAVRTITSISNNEYITVDKGLEQTNTAGLYYVFNQGGGSGVVEYTSPSGSRYVGFKEFAIKIVLLSSNPVYVPRLNDVRAIALQV